MSLIVRVTGLILALAVGCVSAIAALVTYTPSSDDINNPERGFYRHTERRSTDSFPLDPALLASFRAGGSSVIIRVIYLERFVTAPIDAPYLALLQDDFNAIRQAGLKVVIRFAYTDVYHETPPYGDASKSQVLAHIAQLEPLLRSNADVIAVVQAGFIGTWGEWYYTDWFVADPTQPWNITPADYANRREVLYRLLDALPASRPTQLRTPTYKQQVLQTTQPVSPAQAFSGSYLSRTGHHNDCYLASDTDFGTYPDASQSQYPYLSADTLYTPMGGETCNPNPPRSTGSGAVYVATSIANYSVAMANDGSVREATTGYNRLWSNLTRPSFLLRDLEGSTQRHRGCAGTTEPCVVSVVKLFGGFRLGANRPGEAGGVPANRPTKVLLIRARPA